VSPCENPTSFAIPGNFIRYRIAETMGHMFAT